MDMIQLFSNQQTTISFFSDASDRNVAFAYPESNQNTPSNPSTDAVRIENWATINVSRFSKLLSSRLDYLDSLKALGDNWISGNSKQPSAESIEVSKSIIKNFISYIQLKKNIPIPKIVMGPMPVGGICIEFQVDHSNAMYITLENSSKPNIDIKYNDYYFSFENDKIDIGRKVIDRYESIIEL